MHCGGSAVRGARRSQSRVGRCNTRGFTLSAQGLRGARPAAARSMTAAPHGDMLRCPLHPAATSTLLLKTAFVRRLLKTGALSFTQAQVGHGRDASGSQTGKEQGGHQRRCSATLQPQQNPWPCAAQFRIVCRQPIAGELDGLLTLTDRVR